ncbi:hypothetical protein HGO21_16320 [Acinetobacter sp. CUI P1]|nr:hypothetical protein [Acinetobacter sp. CUI P1]
MNIVQTSDLKKKRVLVTTLLLIVLIFLVTFIKSDAASPQPEYGVRYYPYTKEVKTQVIGDLRASGPEQGDHLLFASRKAYALWDDVRFKNVITSTWADATPGGSYLPVLLFQILEQESADKFDARDGYRLVPYYPNGDVNTTQKGTPIKKVADWAGGNPSYVLNKINTVLNGKASSSNVLSADNFYYVGAIPPVDLTENLFFRFNSIVSLSGGGVDEGDMIAQTPTKGVNRGITYPAFKTTYSVTSWPKIHAVFGMESNGEQRELVNAATGKLKISTTTYSYSGHKQKIWIMKGSKTFGDVLNYMNSTTEMSGASDQTRFNDFSPNIYKIFDASGKRTYNYNSSIPMSEMSSLITPDGTVQNFTMVVSDAYDRIAVTNFKVGTYKNDLAIIPSSVKITPGSPQTAGTAAKVTVNVSNKGSKDIASTYLAWRWNTAGNTVSKIPINNFKRGETRSLTFDITYPPQSALLILNINANKDAPTNEIDWLNNRTEVRVGPVQINLRAKEVRLNPTKPQIGNSVNFEVLVENESYTETVTDTYLDWWTNQTLQSQPAKFSLSPREQKWISNLVLPIVPGGNYLYFDAEINKNHNKPVNETKADGTNAWTDNKISKKYQLMSKNLNYFVKTISASSATQNSAVTTRVVVGRERLSSDTNGEKQAAVRLYILDANGNASLIETKSILLPSPGDTRTVFFDWNSGNMAIGNGYNLMATINIQPVDPETTYADNTQIASFEITGSTPPNGNFCSIGATTGVSGTYSYCSRYENIYHPVTGAYIGRDCVNWNEGNYYEYFNAYVSSSLSGSYVEENADEINGIDVPLVQGGSSTVQAGQGFTFAIDAKYTEDRGHQGNLTRAVAHFPKEDGTLQDIDLVKIRTAGNEVTWAMPTAWVAKHGDEVVYQEGSNPGSNDPNDTNYYYPGGRAFYTSLNMPAGTFIVSVDLYAEGVNALHQCVLMQYTVSGTVMDDFYVRQINPEEPFPSPLFPSGPTSLWKDNYDVLQSQSLIDWDNFDESMWNWPKD